MKTSGKSLRVRIRPKNTGSSILHTRTKTCENDEHLIHKSKNNCRRIYDLKDKLKEINHRYQSQVEERGEQKLFCPWETYDLICHGLESRIMKIRNVIQGKNYAVKKILVGEGENREEKICRVIKNDFVAEIRDIFRVRVGLKEEINIIMKLYEFSLADVLVVKPKLDSLNVKIMLYQMVRGIHYLHMKGICHRDIRPSNFLINSKGRLFLSDFGSAKSKKSQSSLCYVGQRAYRAPELHLGCLNYSENVDIWALGCIAIELVTSRQIFNGSGAIDCLLNISRLLGTKQLKRLPGQGELVNLLPNLSGKGLREFVSDESESFLTLVQKMLEVNPKKRIKAIDILADEYFEDLRDEPIFSEIMSTRIDISNFFDFSPIELKNYQQYYQHLIPFWKRQSYRQYIF